MITITDMARASNHLGRSTHVPSLGYYRLMLQRSIPRRHTRCLLYSADRGHVTIGNLSAHCRHHQLFKYSNSSFTNFPCLIFPCLILASPDSYPPVPKNSQLNGKFWASSSAAPVCCFPSLGMGCQRSAVTTSKRL